TRSSLIPHPSSLRGQFHILKPPRSSKIALPIQGRDPMYDLHLTAEQIEFRDTLRDFVEGEVKPAAIHPDRLQPFDKPILLDALDKAAQLGLRTLALSEEAGGAGGDGVTSCIVMEELGAGDVDIAAVLGQTSALAHILFDRL